MRTSETVGKLAGALAKAQGSITPPIKSKTANVGSYKYSYADLAEIIEALRHPLADNGLATVQSIDNDEKGSILVTRLLHESGEWVEASYRLPQATGQQFGSALTYARRYSLSAIVGIAAEDDDDGAIAEKKSRAVPVSSSGLLKMLTDNAKSAAAAGMLDAFRADSEVKQSAMKLGADDLAAFKQVIKDLAEIGK